MAGIVFVRTRTLDAVRRFYQERVGMSVWLEQPGIVILRHGNLLVGFHEQAEADTDSLLTFFDRDREFVDRMYEELREEAEAAPRENPKYRIYHFYVRDPEGRRVEFQYFLHPVEPPGW